jgi:hypothetical protein
MKQWIGLILLGWCSLQAYAQHDKLVFHQGSFLKGTITSVSPDSLLLRTLEGWEVAVPWQHLKYVHLGKKSTVQLPASFIESSRKFQKGHFHSTTIGFLMGKTDYGDPSLAPVVHHVQGHRFSQRTALGLGLSGQFHDEGTFYPLYLQAQYTPWFLPERMLFTGSLGHGWPRHSRGGNDWQHWHKKGGLYQGLGFGVRAPIQGGYFLLLISWTQQRQTLHHTTNWTWGSNFTEERNINRLELTLGLRFH